MVNRIAVLLIIVAAIALVCSCAYASSGNPVIVPEASACVLAPMGIAAIIAAERHRRRVRAVQQGISVFYLVAKRMIDFALASSLLLIALPIFALIACMVRLDSRGPVLYRRRVVGRGGRRFDMFKFRSMVDGAESILEQDEDLKKEYYVAAKLRTDPRVTRLGRFLRMTSLDELPQLINILLGNMTFVGPRPIAPDEIDLYGCAIEHFQKVTPGITGIWQTCGRSETSYATRVEMDLQYIEKRCLLLDLWIIVSTIPAVLLKRGAY